MHEEEGVSGRILNKLVILSLVVGLAGGAGGAWLFLTFGASAIPTAKQQVVLQETSAVTDTFNKVSPSVVSITNTQDTGFNFFFGPTQEQAAGTGIILTSDGLIMTNKHVVPDGVTNVTVYTSDGKQYKNAQVVARDNNNDIAFVKINASGLKPATLGDSSQLKVGDKVLAIGNALGQFQNTLTEGIISGLGRPIVAGDQGSSASSSEALQDLIQTDAAINPGNSGGPLVDLTGNVIGMDTAVAGNGAQNIGFAIPINDAKPLIASVEKQGKIVKPYLGVYYVDITADLAASDNLPVTHGALIQGSGSQPAIVPGSPAESAGLQDGDIILKVGGQDVDQSHPLSQLINQHQIGQEVTLTILRNGKQRDVKVKLAQAPGQ